MGVFSPCVMTWFGLSPAPMLNIMNLSLKLSVLHSIGSWISNQPEGSLGAHRKILEDKPLTGFTLRVVELEGVDRGLSDEVPGVILAGVLRRYGCWTVG